MSLRLRSLLAVFAPGLFIASACEAPPPEPPAPPPAFSPSAAHQTERAPNARGLLDRRGLIHAHSYFSHDACDGKPVDENGDRDAACLDDFRRGLCQVRHDFVFLTDHGDAFDTHEFPDVLLHQPERGDELVTRNADPVASWARCDDGSQALILAGNENNELMPVGLERHVAPIAERGGLYRSRLPEDMARVRAAGAFILQAHTERFRANQLIDMNLDGFEMFNLHQNTFVNAGTVLELLLLNRDEDPYLPHPDLLFLVFLSEDPNYVDTWGTVLSRGVQQVTTMGTDCHRNSFPALLSDGERADSYRRMMKWFSNHLLVEPAADGSWDDRHLKEALRAGRLYGAFEVMGYPEGFDFHATAAGGVVEMGSRVELVDGPDLFVARPRVTSLHPDREQPEITLRVLRAVEGGWEEVAVSKTGDLRYAPTEPGAYRAEVRMVPFHLREHLGADDWDVLGRDHPWIYANPIYVR
jgi:hypothetical protein